MSNKLDKYLSTGIIEIDAAAFKKNVGDSSKLDTGYVKVVFVDQETEARKIVEYAPRTIQITDIGTVAGKWLVFEQNGTITQRELNLSRDELDGTCGSIRVSLFAFVSYRPTFNITGTRLYSPTGTATSYDLYYTFAGQTLSWENGDAVAVGAGGSFTLWSETGDTGSSIQVDVRVSELPGSDQTDLNIVTFNTDTITGVFVFPIFHSQNLDEISNVITRGSIKKSGLEVEPGGTDLSLKQLAGEINRIGAGETRERINFPTVDQAVGYTFLPATSALTGVASLDGATTQIPTDKYACADGLLNTATDGNYIIMYGIDFASYDYETISKRMTRFLIYGYGEYKSRNDAIRAAGGNDIIIPTSIEGACVDAAFVIKKGETNLTDAVSNGDAIILIADEYGDLIKPNPGTPNVIEVTSKDQLPHGYYLEYPTNITGVYLKDQTGAAGTYDLVYAFSGQTLSWDGGTPVAVGAGGEFTLDDGSGNTVVAVVTAGSLPGSDQSDLGLVVNSGPAVEFPADIQYEIHENIVLLPGEKAYNSSTGNVGFSTVAGKSVTYLGKDEFWNGGVAVGKFLGFIGSSFINVPYGGLFSDDFFVDGTLSIQNLVVGSCARLGKIIGGTGSRFNVETNFLVLGTGQPLELNNITSVTIGVTTFEDGRNEVGGGMYRITGSSTDVIEILKLRSKLESNESMLYIAPSVADNLEGIGTIHVGKMRGDGSFLASGSADEEHPRLQFSGNDPIADSTVVLEARSEGNTTTFVNIPAVNAKILVTTGINFIADKVSRTELNINGTGKYIGTENVTLKLSSNVNMDPQTAAKNLRAQFFGTKPTQRIVTFNNITDVINETATPRVNGDIITFKNSAGTLSTGLRKDVVYYVVNKQTDTFQVSYTLGGAAINFTDNGTGTNSYQLGELCGAIGRANITAGNSIDVFPNGIADFFTNCEVNVVVWNATDSVAILIRNIYYSVRK